MADSLLIATARAADKVLDCLNEFEGDCSCCGEWLDALTDNVDKLKQLYPEAFHRFGGATMFDPAADETRAELERRVTDNALKTFQDVYAEAYRHGRQRYAAELRALAETHGAERAMQLLERYDRQGEERPKLRLDWKDATPSES